MDKILVTGASGLVGREVIQALMKKTNTRVYAATSRPEIVCSAEDNLQIVKNSQLEDLFRTQQIDVLLHLAFPRNVNPEQWADGIRYAIHVLALAKKYQISRVVHVSSQSIYGLQRMEPANESSPIVLNSPYTMGKYCMELFVEQMFSEMTYLNIRLSTIIGPTTEERLPNKFLRKVLNKEDFIIQGGSQRFSFLDVRDAADGIIALMESEWDLWNRSVNLGSAESHSICEIAQIALELGAQKGCCDSKIIVNPSETVMNNSLDVSRLWDCYNWSARYSLAEAMEFIFSNYCAESTTSLKGSVIQK